MKLHTRMFGQGMIGTEKSFSMEQFSNQSIDELINKQISKEADTAVYWVATDNERKDICLVISRDPALGLAMDIDLKTTVSNKDLFEKDYSNLKVSDLLKPTIESVSFSQHGGDDYFYYVCQGRGAKLVFEHVENHHEELLEKMSLSNKVKIK